MAARYTHTSVSSRCAALSWLATEAAGASHVSGYPSLCRFADLPFPSQSLPLFVLDQVTARLWSSDRVFRVRCRTSPRLPAVRQTLAERILSEAALHRLLTLEPNERNRTLLTLLYGAGVRRSEVADLRWRDLQATSGGGQVTVFGKGGKTRSIQLPNRFGISCRRCGVPRLWPIQFSAPVRLARRSAPQLSGGLFVEQRFAVV